MKIILIDFTGTQQQATGALTHVQRIIKEKSSLFIHETSKRYCPT